MLASSAGGRPILGCGFYGIFDATLPALREGRVPARGGLGSGGLAQSGLTQSRKVAKGVLWATGLTSVDTRQEKNMHVRMKRWILAACLILAWLALPVNAQAPPESQADDWVSAAVPEVWKSPPRGPLATTEGVVWYRAVVQLPADWADQPAELFVEGVDDARQIFINGQRIGLLGTFPPEYRSGLGQQHHLAIPADVLRAGEPNLIAIRVYHYHGRRGFNVAAPVLLGRDQAIRLQGNWQAIADDQERFANLSARFQIDSEQWFSTTIDRAQADAELKRLADDAGPQTPANALAHLRTDPQLAVDLVLSDPVIGQPLSIKWDHRGRLWLVEYLQYPDPAGLTAVSRDQFLRTVWDRLPDPPPNHFPGADRVSVHEDTDGDGVYDRHHVFVDGLSLVTSIALDQHGVWVLNPPHLLFYPDRDGDGVADGDPEVHLEGFGLEDSHSLVNSLRFGPDGWLYGAQGSTVSGAVRRYGSDDPPARSVGQLIWRYHPPTQRYEVFSEGGGNAFGVEFDSAGRLFSGHNGGNTRGFHYLPGGYFHKGFGKHGELSNPHAFGYLEAMPHHQAERFTHTFVINQSDALPGSMRGRLFGVEPLQGRVIMSEMVRQGSSFQTRDLGHALWSEGDTWFRPVDIQEGPDGALYIADFYEQRIDHASHFQGRIDRDSGRIYRLRAKDAVPPDALPDPDDLDAWVERLRSPIRWQQQTAIRRIVERCQQGDSAGIDPASIDPETRAEVIERLHGWLSEGESVSESDALGALWTLAQIEPLDAQQGVRLLGHPHAAVRSWAIRLVDQSGGWGGVAADRLLTLAAAEPDLEVRCQLAATARSLAPDHALPLIQTLAAEPQDARLSLMVWWALEAQISRDAKAVLAWWLANDSMGDVPLVRTSLAGKTMQRFASAGTRDDLLACAALLSATSARATTPDRAAADEMLAGFERAFRGRSLSSLPEELVQAIAASGGGSLPLRVRAGDAAAIDTVVQTAGDRQVSTDRRIESLQLLGDVHPAGTVDAVLAVATSADESEPIQRAALAALQGYDRSQIGPQVLAALQRYQDGSRVAALELLASRADWAGQLLDAIDANALTPSSVPESVVRQLHMHRDEALRKRLVRHWGQLVGADQTQITAEIDRCLDAMDAGIGNPIVGKRLFATHCGSCHQLFGQGGETGPDLTSYQRQDLRGMITHVVHPDLEIREGYENHLVLTEDGRAINGLQVDADQQVVVIRDAGGNTRTIPRDEILEMTAVPQSLMPQGLLVTLDAQKIRDLFAYLRSAQPIP